MSLIMLKTHLILILALIIGGCSNKYFTSNFDRNTIKQYFSASQVKIYPQEKDIELRHDYIGVVEGQDCQEKPHHAVPDEVNARTQARQQAFDKKANGVVFTGCALLSSEQLAKLNNRNDTQQCHAIVICYAKAFAVALAVEK